MRTLLLLFPVLLLLPATAFAQTPAADLAYCNRLADLYERYIGRNDFSPGRSFGRGSLEATSPPSSAAPASRTAFPCWSG